MSWIDQNGNVRYDPIPAGVEPLMLPGLSGSTTAPVPALTPAPARLRRVRHTPATDEPSPSPPPATRSSALALRPNTASSLPEQVQRVMPDLIRMAGQPWQPVPVSKAKRRRLRRAAGAGLGAAAASLLPGRVPDELKAAAGGALGVVAARVLDALLSEDPPDTSGYG